MHQRNFLMMFVGVVMVSATWVAADIVSGSPVTGSSNDGSVTPITLSQPTGVSAGTLLLASIAVNGGAPVNVSAPAGWSLVQRTDNDTNVSLFTYQKIAAASEPAKYTWLIDNQTTAQGGITPYNGVNAPQPIESATSNYGYGLTATTTPTTTSSGSTTVVSVFAVTAGKVSTASNYFSTPVGMGEKYDTSNTPYGPSLASFERIQSNAGPSGSATSAINNNKNLHWVSQQIVIRGVAPDTTDNFESYSSGTLDGGNGGTNWTGAWAGSSAFLVQSAVAAEGSRAVQVTQGYAQEPSILRSFAPKTSGTVHWIESKDSIDHDQGIALFSGGTFIGHISMAGTGRSNEGNWQITNGGTVANLTGYATNTFYAVDVQFDTSTDKFRASIDGGPYSPWYDFVVPVANVDGIALFASASGVGSTNGYWDDVKITE